jgi:lipoprotein-anchoring transpeptidase ErfK/SrfK
MDLGPLHPAFLHRLQLRGVEIRRLLASALGRDGSRTRRHGVSRRPCLRPLLLAAAVALLAGCAGDTRHVILISTGDQRMVVLDRGKLVASYPVSTSKYGLGDGFGSYCTPMGLMKVRKKIGAGAPAGAVFKSRRLTGEVIAVDAPGRDPIVTRILWLDGLEPGNAGAKGRGIYIHGTVEEGKLGQPMSYGCIRMRSRDVIELYDLVGVGARVKVVESLPTGS